MNLTIYGKSVLTKPDEISALSHMRKFKDMLMVWTVRVSTHCISYT